MYRWFGSDSSASMCKWKKTACDLNGIINKENRTDLRQRLNGWFFFLFNKWSVERHSKSRNDIIVNSVDHQSDKQGERIITGGVRSPIEDYSNWSSHFKHLYCTSNLKRVSCCFLWIFEHLLTRSSQRTQGFDVT